MNLCVYFFPVFKSIDFFSSQSVGSYGYCFTKWFIEIKFQLNKQNSVAKLRGLVIEIVQQRMRRNGCFSEKKTSSLRDEFKIYRGVKNNYV